MRNMSKGANPLGNEELRQHDSEGEYQRGLMKIWNKDGDLKPTSLSVTAATLSIRHALTQFTFCETTT